MLCEDLQKNRITTGVIKKSLSKGSDITTPSVFSLVIDCSVATELDPEVEITTDDNNG
jgi:hypothetical protein